MVDIKNETLPLHHLDNLNEVYGWGNRHSPMVRECFGWWVVMENRDVILVSREAYSTGNRKAEPYVVDETAIFDEDWVDYLQQVPWFTKECEHDFIKAINYAKTLSA